MKNKNPFFFICLVWVFFFTSCANGYSDLFISEGVDSRITQKTSMKPFSGLAEESIVITMPVYENKNLLGNAGFGHKVNKVGNIFVVYDCAGDAIWDWAFTEGSLGWSNWRAVRAAGKYCISGQDGTASVLDPETGRIAVYNHGIQTWIDSYDTDGDYVLLGESSYITIEEQVQRYYAFNVRTGTLNPGCMTFHTDDASLFHPISDEDGIFWLTFAYKKNTRLIKLNPELVTCQDVGLEIPEKRDGREYEYVARVADSSSVYMTWYCYEKGGTEQKNLIFKTVDVSGSPVQTKDWQLPVSDDWYLERFHYIDGYHCYIYMDIDDFSKTTIYKCHYDENQCIVDEQKAVSIDFTEQTYARNSRIYLLNSRNSRVFTYLYYDTATGEASTAKTYTFNDIVKL